MIDLLPSQNGTMHHQEMLREAAERQQFAALRPQNGGGQPYLRIVRAISGRTRMLVQRLVAQPSPKAEHPSTEMTWKTS
ncbi:MAG: hypothetical protein K8J31_08155 [Anaerolineae bacterium]|nr:hypothetical protein [Anaerolineae bacterium]